MYKDQLKNNLIKHNIPGLDEVKLNYTDYEFQPTYT
jgi:hypothetical protein